MLYRDFAELVEIIDDVLPFEIAVTARGEAVEQLLLSNTARKLQKI